MLASTTGSTSVVSELERECEYGRELAVAFVSRRLEGRRREMGGVAGGERGK